MLYWTHISTLFTLFYVKRYGPPPQTTSWETHKEISPVIPLLGELAEHIEDNLIDLRQTRVHKEISAELDISRLASRHLQSKIHTYSPNQEIEVASDMAKDYVQLGTQSLIQTDWLAKLEENRAMYLDIRSMEQLYSLAEPAPSSNPASSGWHQEGQDGGVLGQNLDLGVDPGSEAHVQVMEQV
ncbi:hypothetical protein FS749_006748 [Ceratobasidium sp. UAMH 11750]|nr:hypothetical protein FS749_006748 [Ceratobasidium sp. UAMH 11750]